MGKYTFGRTATQPGVRHVGKMGFLAGGMLILAGLGLTQLTPSASSAAYWRHHRTHGTTTTTTAPPTTTTTDPPPTTTTTTAPPPTTTTTQPSAAPANCPVSGATGATATATFSVPAPVSGDNTAAIQNVIDTASNDGGGVVQLKAGTYVIDGHLQMKSNVALDGAGEGQTTIQAGPNFLSTTLYGGYPIVSTAGASNVTLENFTADQSGQTLTAAANEGGRLSAYMVEARGGANTVIQDVATIDPFTYSIAAVDTTQFCFDNNKVLQNPAENGLYDQLDGIHVLDSNTGDVRDNYVDQRYGGATDGDDGLVAHSINADVYNIDYVGNVVRGGNNGDDMQLALGDSIYDITIENNEFWGGPFGIRTGVYSSGANSVYNITVEDNIIHNNVGGTGTEGAFPDGGNAIDFTYSPSPTNLTVTGNYYCSAGSINVPSGTGNTVSNNPAYTGCVDEASTSTPPAVYPPA